MVYQREQEEKYGTGDDQTPSSSTPSAASPPTPSASPAPSPSANVSNSSSTGLVAVPIEDCPVGMSLFDHPTVVSSRKSYDATLAGELKSKAPFPTLSGGATRITTLLAAAKAGQGLPADYRVPALGAMGAAM